MTIKILMQHHKDTKNTHVYHEMDDAGHVPADFVASIPTLYIRKHAFDGIEVPNHITVEVTSA